MIRSLFRGPDGQVRTDVKADEFATLLQVEGGLLWVDLMDEPNEVCEPILHDTFGFHPLAVDDALQESHVPKVDDWGSHLYVVLHAMLYEKDDGDRVDTLELDAFLGKQYLVLHHDQPITAVDRVWGLCQRDPRHLEKGADHLLYRLVDEIVAGYMPVVEEMDETIDSLEDQIFGVASPHTVERLFALKRALLHQRRILLPQREVLNKLARDDYAVIDPAERPFFRDVYDHLVRLHDINESMRDLVGGALDTYLSVVNNRLNEVMKTLTIITTMFMPISFVAGFFGMNFFQPVLAPLKAWTGNVPFLLMMAVTILTPVGMYFWLRKRAWM
jgi:magnesium transporter